jgi:hypothetical protein
MTITTENYVPGCEDKPKDAGAAVSAMTKTNYYAQETANRINGAYEEDVRSVLEGRPTKGNHPVRHFK